MRGAARRLAFDFLALTLVAVFLVGMFRLFRQPSGAPGVPTEESRIDPTPYRATIERLDEILYDAAPPDVAAGQEALALVNELGDAVLQTAGRRVRNRAGSELLGFGTWIAGQGDLYLEPIDLPRVRAEWERVRERVFRRALWFRSAP